MNQNEKWYYARNKETIGPMLLSDIRNLLKRGELKVGDLVYHEMLGNWTPAGKVAILQDAFTAAPPVGGPPLSINKVTPPSVQPRNGASTAKTTMPPSGHITIRSGKTESAPVQTLTPVTATPGATATTPIASDQESKSETEKGTPQTAGGGTLFDVSESISDPDEINVSSNMVQPEQILYEKQGLLDFIPQLLRNQFTAAFANRLGRFFTYTGIWFQLIGLILVLVYTVKVSVFNSISLFDAISLNGLSITLILATFYVNCRLMPSLHRLNRLGEGRLVSNALPDSFAMLCLIFGIYWVAGTFAAGLQSGEVLVTLESIVLAIIYFALFGYGAISAANSSSLGMTVDGTLSTAAEAAGAIQYVSKLVLRLALCGYGICMMSGTMLLLFSLITKSADIFEQLNAVVLPFKIMCCSFVPLIAYIIFLGFQFFLDFAQKVVQNSRRG